MKSFFIAFSATVFLFGKLILECFNPSNVVAFQPTTKAIALIFATFIICIIILFVFLKIASGRYPKHYDKIILVLLLISFYNLSEYFIFSLVSNIRLGKLIAVAIGIVYLPGAIWCGIKFGSHNLTEKLMVVLLPPCLLVCLYGVYRVPKGIFSTHIEKEYRVAGNLPPIHLLICDGLSWDVFFKQGEVDPEFKNFREFSSKAHVYLNAYGIGGDSKSALSQLLTGHRYEKVRFSFTDWLVSEPESDGFRPIPINETLFKSAVDAGYNNVVTGFYLPYTTTFQNLITYGHGIQLHLIPQRALQIVPSLLLFPRHIKHAEAFEKGFGGYLEQVAKAPTNTFFYSHLSLPHDPFPYKKDGRLIGRMEFYWYEVVKDKKDILRRYRRSIAQLDRSFGQLLNLMKKESRFTDSLIIITSDHNLLGCTLPQVPLLIKVPNQQQYIKHHEKVDLFHLNNFIETYFRTGTAKLESLKG